MTRVEAEAAMQTAKQAELISMHADRSAPTSKPTFKNKKSKGRGGGKGGGGKAFPFVSSAAAATTTATTVGGISVGTSGKLTSPAQYPSLYQPRQSW